MTEIVRCVVASLFFWDISWQDWACSQQNLVYSHHTKWGFIKTGIRAYPSFWNQDMMFECTNTKTGYLKTRSEAWHSSPSKHSLTDGGTKRKIRPRNALMIRDVCWSWNSVIFSILNLRKNHFTGLWMISGVEHKQLWLSDPPSEPTRTTLIQTNHIRKQRTLSSF